jgi:hypothetical protein
MRRSAELRLSRSAEARAARAEVESALDANGWRWSARISRWLDMLVVVEESANSS